MKTLACTLLITAAFVAGSQAADRYVAQAGQTAVYPYADWDTAATNIDEAIRGATHGTTVYVTNGTYYLGAAIGVTSNLLIRSYHDGALDRAGTILDGNNYVGKPVTNRCLTLGGAGAVVDGFTITNGLVVSGNGGGVYISAGTLRNCLLTGNSVTNGSGGGVYATGASSLVTNCDMIANVAWGPGAGAYITTSARLAGSRLRRNRTMRAPGGDGAGANVADSALMLNCEVVSNTTVSGSPGDIGAGVTVSAATLRNCLIVGNSGSYSGGGVGAYANGVVENCTIAGNSSGSGAGIGTGYNEQNIHLRNTISIDAVRGSYNLSNLLITNCCFPDSNILYIAGTVTNNVFARGTGNLTTPPVFVNAAGGDYRQRPWSVGVDTGLWQGWMTNAADLAGQPRLSENNLPDRGAYETTAEMAPTQYVAQGGQTPEPPYTNWAQAATSINDAIDAGLDGCAILVSNGTYLLTKQVVVGNRTIQSCNNGVLDRNGTVVNGGYPQQTNRCFYLNSAVAVVAGFTITNGFAASANGGGIYMTAGLVTNCTVTGNAAASGNGGGVYIAGGTLRECAVAGNLATNGSGGGVYATGSGALVTDCELTGNAAYGSGAGAYLTTSARLTGSRIAGNRIRRTLSYGAGVYVGDGAVLWNCEIVSNVQATLDGSTQMGGGVWIDYLNATVRNCLIVRNTSWLGAGIGITSAGTQGGIVDSCTIASNTGTLGAGIGMVGLDTGKAHIRNTICRDGVGVWYGRPTYLAPSFYVTNSCLLATNVATGTNNTWSASITNDPRFADTAAGNFRLRHDSPCINAGFLEGWMSGATDLDGNARVSPSIRGMVDMGAYERPLQSGLILTLW